MLLYALPLSTAAVVGFAILVAGAPRPYVGARLYGGPTEGATRLAWRLAVVEHYRGVEAPIVSGPVEVEVAFGGGRSATFRGTLDALGMAEASVEVPGGPLRQAPSVRVLREGDTLAEGRVWLSADEWLARARRRGGFVDVPGTGALEVRVALGRGALAVPFAEPIWIEVRRRSGDPIAGVEVHVEPEGMSLVRPAARDAVVTTDDQGRAEIVVAPREHAVALRVVAEHGGERGQWYATLPVVPGAIQTKLQGGRLRIESPVARDVAYYALLGERARLAGGPVMLEPDGRGGAVQLVALPPLPDGPLWAEASSEPELATEATVGWPLRLPQRPHGEPPRTLAVPDRLLLDGLPRGAAAEEARRDRARLIAGGYSLIALTLASLIVALRARRADTRLRAHLESAGAEQDSRDRIAQRRVGPVAVAVAVLCITLGFALIALLALYRLG